MIWWFIWVVMVWIELDVMIWIELSVMIWIELGSDDLGVELGCGGLD